MNREEMAKFADSVILKTIPLPIIRKGVEVPPLVNAIEDHLIKLNARKQLLLPNFQNGHTETIAVFSDYGGSSTDSLYDTYSFLLCSYDILDFFFEAMFEIREKYHLNEPPKEISFKDMRYGPINRSLSEYLLKANNVVNGLIFTVIIEKKIYSLIPESQKSLLDEVQKKLKDSGYGEWKRKIVERLFIITHVIAYFLALLGKKEQQVLWMTDEDDIIASKEQLNGTMNLFSSVIKLYSPEGFKKVAFSKPFDLAEDIKKRRVFSDLLSVPDIVAGSLEHYYSRSKKQDEIIIKKGANKVLLWLTEHGICLKKIAMILKADDTGMLQSGIVQLTAKESIKNMEIIYSKL